MSEKNKEKMKFCHFSRFGLFEYMFGITDIYQK